MAGIRSSEPCGPPFLQQGLRGPAGRVLRGYYGPPVYRLVMYRDSPFAGVPSTNSPNSTRAATARPAHGARRPGSRPASRPRARLLTAGVPFGGPCPGKKLCRFRPPGDPWAGSRKAGCWVLSVLFVSAMVWPKKYMPHALNTRPPPRAGGGRVEDSSAVSRPSG